MHPEEKKGVGFPIGEKKGKEVRRLSISNHRRKFPQGIKSAGTFSRAGTDTSQEKYLRMESVNSKRKLYPNSEKDTRQKRRRTRCDHSQKRRKEGDNPLLSEERKETSNTREADLVKKGERDGVP